MTSNVCKPRIYLLLRYSVVVVFFVSDVDQKLPGACVLLLHVHASPEGANIRGGVPLP
jgi:hypothetical protein